MKRPLRIFGPLAIVSTLTPLAWGIMARDYSVTFRAHGPALQACFETERAHAPAFDAGWMAVAYQVGPEGRLGSARVLGASTPRMNAVSACVTALANGWTFERSSSGRVMNLRMEFHAGSPAPTIQ